MYLLMHQLGTPYFPVFLQIMLKKSFILQFVIEHKLQNQTATCKIGILPLGILPRAEKGPKGIDSMTDFSQSSLQSM